MFHVKHCGRRQTGWSWYLQPGTGASGTLRAYSSSLGCPPARERQLRGPRRADDGGLGRLVVYFVNCAQNPYPQPRYLASVAQTNACRPAELSMYDGCGALRRWCAATTADAVACSLPARKKGFDSTQAGRGALASPRLWRERPGPGLPRSEYFLPPLEAVPERCC